MIGTTLGRYQILEKIGEGGMGVVYLARDAHLQRDVAIKVLPAGALGDELARNRFRKEALALSKLNHPNIGTVHDFDTKDDVDFLVMEYIPGTTLHDRLKSGPLPAHEAVNLGEQLVEGLIAAHAQGVIHRDLKPANLRITPDGRLKILDFGLAKLVPTQGEVGVSERITETQGVIGTLPYMAPEQLREQPADDRTDIYAAGAVLLEMATGRRAFSESSAPSLIDAILNRAPSLPREMNSPISPGLHRITMRCLEKKPESRYQTAKELLADLQRLESPLSSLRTMRFPVRRMSWRMVLLAGLALVAAVAAIVFWMTLGTPALAFAKRDWILIADFENLTGEELFDKSLDTALRISIEQSSYVNVLSKRRITEALRRMKKENTQRINAAIGREIAEREGIKVLLAPSIAGVGGAYALSSSIEDPKTGVVFKSEMRRAQSKRDVLDALDALAGLIRRDLGETAAMISAQGKPLAKVTTSSLEALKQYSIAIQNHRDGKYGEARTYYENALALDPDFTSAKSSLGMIHCESAQVKSSSGIVRFQGIDGELGKKLLGEAVSQADKLTERERFGIQAFYARAVENDVPKAIRHLKASSTLYPDDAAVHNNLGWFYRQIQAYDEAIAEYKEAIRADPAMMLAYDGLSGIYLYLLGRVSDAISHCRNQLAQNDSHWQAYANLGWAYLGKGEPGNAQKELETALKLNSSSTLELFRLAHAFRLQKNYSKALETLERIPAIDSSESIHYDMGVIYQLMNNRKEARKHFELARAEFEKSMRTNPKNNAYPIELAIVRLRLGQTSELRLPGRHGVAADPEESFLRANYYSVQGNADKAIGQLELAISNGWNNYIWMRIHPDHEILANEPRFQALLNKVLH